MKRIPKSRMLASSFLFAAAFFVTPAIFFLTGNFLIGSLAFFVLQFCALFTALGFKPKPDIDVNETFE